ncbi:S-adenosyl-L-methionine-dependent methyltransferase, partial [Macroventuria anomochaeta]
VLEVGCGAGSITISVPQGSVTGVDLSETVLGQAREHLASQEEKELVGGEVDFRVGNVVEGLEFKDGEFPVVLCHQTLVHIPEPVKAMRGMRRVCKKGGIVACREGAWAVSVLR